MEAVDGRDRRGSSRCRRAGVVGVRADGQDHRRLGVGGQALGAQHVGVQRGAVGLGKYSSCQSRRAARRRTTAAGQQQGGGEGRGDRAASNAGFRWLRVGTGGRPVVSRPAGSGVAAGTWLRTQVLRTLLGGPGSTASRASVKNGRLIRPPCTVTSAWSGRRRAHQSCCCRSRGRRSGGRRELPVGRHQVRGRSARCRGSCGPGG